MVITREAVVSNGMKISGPHHAATSVLNMFKACSRGVVTSEAFDAGTSPAFLSVRTIRPDGHRRFTRDLIPHDVSDVATWGRGSGQFLGIVSKERVVWQQEGPVFHWSKLH